MGSFVAQQLAVTHPEKVNRLVLVAASCGGKQGTPESPRLVKFFSEMVNKSINNIPITPQDVKQYFLSKSKTILEVTRNGPPGSKTTTYQINPPLD